MLRQSEAHLGEHVPGGLHIVGSGGKGTATLTPWVGIFDPDETTSPEEGLYLVFLWATDLQSVNLMLLQGITKLDRALGHSEARRILAAEANTIRAALPPSTLSGLDIAVNLGGSGFRQRGYSASCVVAKRYELASLPSETQLKEDLDRFVTVYQDAIETTRRLGLTTVATTMQTASSHLENEESDLLARFRPKDDSDYVARLQERALIKSRRHERLIAEYGSWASNQRFAPSTREHPCDLVLRKAGVEWLVEAKVVYRGNATQAVRAALGQLLTYRHFLWPPGTAPQPVALFSEPIGEAYVRFLEHLEIAAVWKEYGRWIGSATAVSDGVARAHDQDSNFDSPSLKV